MLADDWLNKDFCNAYVQKTELSNDEVHYGWLAPGEDTLGLIGNIESGQCVLDVGCGSGENLISLAKRGAQVFGIDISEHMLEIASDNWSQEFEHRSSESLRRQPMQEFDAFSGVQFDLILSIYSMEYLASLIEFRQVMTNLFRRLNNSGKMIVCFSHPSQHDAHPRLLNHTAFASFAPGSYLIYSFVDTVTTFHEVGFEIERIVEQSTKAPSKITYEESLPFPYRFADGHNPCKEKFDYISDASPHTVIYSLRKPDQISSEDHSIMRILPGTHDKTRIWGINHTVIGKEQIRANQKLFEVIKVAPYDSLVAYCPVTAFTFDREPSVKPSTASEAPPNSEDRPRFQPTGLMAFVDGVLHDEGLIPSYGSRFENAGALESFYIRSIDPLHGKLVELFPKSEIGVLIFVNDHEPAGGTVSMDTYIPIRGDRIDIVYVVSGWGKQWRQRKDAPPYAQMSLFDY